MCRVVYVHMLYSDLQRISSQSFKHIVIWCNLLVFAYLSWDVDWQIWIKTGFTGYKVEQRERERVVTTQPPSHVIRNLKRYQNSSTCVCHSRDWSALSMRREDWCHFFCGWKKCLRTTANCTSSKCICYIIYNIICITYK